MKTQAATDQHDGLLLPGLDGTNPLGFLAALGVLRTLDMRNDGQAVRMRWQQSNGSWIPRVYNGGRDIDELLTYLDDGFRASDSSPWDISKKLPFEGDCLRDNILEALPVSSCRCRDCADTLGSFGVESIRDAKGIFKDTSLRMVRAGDSVGNGFLAYGKRILDETTRDDLCSALTESWKYEDGGCALRWDPSEHHGYAMQWTDPSKENTVSVRGGNRLALAGMPLLTTIPLNATRVETVAFGRPCDRQNCLSWPIWNVPCCLGVVKSIVAFAAIQDSQPDPLELRARGIEAVYRCGRIKTSTYYRNFTPPERVA